MHTSQRFLLAQLLLEPQRLRKWNHDARKTADGTEPAGESEGWAEESRGERCTERGDGDADGEGSGQGEGEGQGAGSGGGSRGGACGWSRRRRALTRRSSSSASKCKRTFGHATTHNETQYGVPRVCEMVA